MAALIAVALVAACDSVPDRIDGLWGAQGVQMEARAEGATIDYTCFRVTTTEPLVLDGDRSFRVPGVRGFWGGARFAPVPDEPVVVKGTLIGSINLVHLVIELSSGEELKLIAADADTFALRRGPGNVLPCEIRTLDASAR